jgi:hypothetical protein
MSPSHTGPSSPHLQILNKVTRQCHRKIPCESTLAETHLWVVGTWRKFELLDCRSSSPPTFHESLCGYSGGCKEPFHRSILTRATAQQCKFVADKSKELKGEFRSQLLFGLELFRLRFHKIHILGSPAS